jgi:hypothetical protein
LIIWFKSKPYRERSKVKTNYKIMVKTEKPTGEASEIRPGIWVVDSVTQVGPGLAKQVLIGGSHCGIYAAYLAAKAGVRGLILNDAGIGLGQAGIAGLDYLEQFGVAAATVDYRSARIGDGEDCANQGTISYCNSAAKALGVEAGQAALLAASFLLHSNPRTFSVPEAYETRHLVAKGSSGREAWALDSVSLVRPSDAGQIIIAGSHGGVLGGRPETAIKIDAFAAFYNDAGVGKDMAGISRLPALEARGIIGGAVSAQSARIGDGRSTYETGIISHINAVAAAVGARLNMPLKIFIQKLVQN